LFISLHCNSFTRPISGLEVFVSDIYWKSTKDNIELALARIVIDRILEYNHQKNRGIKTSKLYIQGIVCPAILIEMWFMNDPKFLSYYEKNKNRLAESIANWIMEYLRK
jgi:N-acetylmuramoyl-L-alanine amidase